MRFKKNAMSQRVENVQKKHEFDLKIFVSIF